MIQGCFLVTIAYHNEVTWKHQSSALPTLSERQPPGTSVSFTKMTPSNRNIFRVTGPLWGDSPVTDGFPTPGLVTRSFDVSLICAWINGWVNNHVDGILKRHRAHCDVILMQSFLVPYEFILVSQRWSPNTETIMPFCQCHWHNPKPKMRK